MGPRAKRMAGPHSPGPAGPPCRLAPESERLRVRAPFSGQGYSLAFGAQTTNVWDRGFFGPNGFLQVLGVMKRPKTVVLGLAGFYMNLKKFL